MCIYMYAAATAAKSLQLCPTLCDPIDTSPPGSPVPGILQARTLGVLRRGQGTRSKSGKETRTSHKEHHFLVTGDP